MLVLCGFREWRLLDVGPRRFIKLYGGIKMMNLEHINKIMKQMEETKKLEAGIQGISEFHDQQDRIFNSIHGMGCDTYYIVNGYDGSAKIISNTQFETETETRAMVAE